MRKTAIITLTIVVVFYICAVEPCDTNQFQCYDGQCISNEHRCDNDFNCEDRSDELNCSYVYECHEGLHRCYNGQCVAELNICPSPILIQTEISSTRTSQLQSSSLYISTSVGIAATSALYMPQSSVIETTTASGDSASIQLRSTLLIPTTVIFYTCCSFCCWFWLVDQYFVYLTDVIKEMSK